MNSLLGYGSDDDYDDSSEEKQTPSQACTSKSKPPSSDVNYEEVQMDLSEGSNDSPKPETKESSADRKRSSHRYEDSRSRRRSDKESKSRRDRDRRRRSTSRERRRSDRDRSRSRDRNRRSTKRYDRPKSDPEKQEKMVAPIEEKTQNDSFFTPGISGRFRDQIEKRKQLWQKKPTEHINPNGQSKKVWETTTFAQDTDGKVASKFKRLMGIKGETGSSGSSVDGLKKQEEMFSSMEQQYEVARTATHTMRGVGLGFGSFNR